jgi:hypothetical protein
MSYDPPCPMTVIHCRSLCKLEAARGGADNSSQEGEEDIYIHTHYYLILYIHLPGVMAVDFVVSRRKHNVGLGNSILALANMCTRVPYALLGAGHEFRVFRGGVRTDVRWVLDFTGPGERGKRAFSKAGIPTNRAQLLLQIRY